MIKNNKKKGWASQCRLTSLEHCGQLTLGHRIPPLIIYNFLGEPSNEN